MDGYGCRTSGFLLGRIFLVQYSVDLRAHAHIQYPSSAHTGVIVMVVVGGLKALRGP